MSLIEWLLLLKLFADLAIFTFLGVVVFGIVILFLDQWIRNRLRNKKDGGQEI